MEHRTAMAPTSLDRHLSEPLDLVSRPLDLRAPSAETVEVEPRLRRGLHALDALADADPGPPAEQLGRAVAVVVQAGERRFQAIHRHRARPAERAERVLAELA